MIEFVQKCQKLMSNTPFLEKNVENDIIKMYYILSEEIKLSGNAIGSICKIREKLLIM